MINQMRQMRIGVYGLWHLGTVTASALIEAGYDIIAIQDDLPMGRTPPTEPGLRSYPIAQDRPETYTYLDLLWICLDTPLDHNEAPRTDLVIQAIERVLLWLKPGCIVLVSSQLRVGSTRKLARNHPHLTLAYSPENIRRGIGLHTFKSQARIVVGSHEGHPISPIDRLLRRFCPTILWMNFESAEMTKHALNSYLAMCITFANEIARISKHTGANPTDVELALLTEPRVSYNAPIRYGNPFSGGTLARELITLSSLTTNPLFRAILHTNELHSQLTGVNIPEHEAEIPT